MSWKTLSLALSAIVVFFSASDAIAASAFYVDNAPVWTTTDTNTSSSASISTVTADTSRAVITDSPSAGAQSSQAGGAPAYQSSRYGYDELDRLRWVQYEDGTVISYDYDRVGNRTAKNTYTTAATGSFTITATFSGNGSLVPSGTLNVPSGSSQHFLIKPNPGAYAYVRIDGVSVNDYPYYNCAFGYPSRDVPCQARGLSNWPDPLYTFQGVSADHSITVEFISPDGDLNGDGQVNAGDTTIANSYIQFHQGGWGNPSYYLYFAMPFNLLAHADVASLAGYLQPDAKFDLSDAYTIGLIAQGAIPSPVWQQPCGNYPARIATATPPNFVNHLSLQSAYNAAASGDTIQGNMYDHFESLLLDRNVSVSLDGGYLCDYTAPSGNINVKGSVAISAGDITIVSGAVVISGP